MKPLDSLPTPTPARLVKAFAQYEGRQSAQDIIEKFSQQSGVSIADLKGPSRLRYISHPRQHLMALLKASGKSYPWIGSFLGGRDHTTILHGVRVHEARVAKRGDA